MKGNIIIMWIFMLAAIFLLLLAIKPDLPIGMKEGWNSLVNEVWAPFTSTTKSISVTTPNVTKVILPVPYP